MIWHFGCWCSCYRETKNIFGILHYSQIIIKCPGLLLLRLVTWSLLSGWETYFPLALRFVPASTDYLTSPKTPPPTQRHNHTPMFTHSLALSAIVSCPQKPIDWYCCCADSKNMFPIVYSKMDCLYRNALLPIHNSVSLTQVIQLYVFTTINIFPKLISNKQTHTSKFKKWQKKTQKSWYSSFKDKWTTTHTKKNPLIDSCLEEKV